MKLQHRHWSMAAGCMLLSSMALAQGAPGVLALGQGAQMLARFEQMSERQLKALFLHCSREASQRLMSLDEGAWCSAAQDALKRRCFGGDFNALLAWWRVHRDDPIDEGDAAGGPAL